MTSASRRIPALRVHQWVRVWDDFEYAEARRRKPDPDFYVASIPAVQLRQLCGIQRRSTTNMKPRADDTGIQRRHEADRSEEISRFITSGHPWADLTPAQKADPSFANLRKPGWLPTAIVVNVLTAADDRYGARVAAEDRIGIDNSGNGPSIVLPSSYRGPSWKPKGLPPLEVIDGQHRLWAVESGTVPSDFELPVVLFVGLDISWQAYLFWTINIKPKRINASLAFDLYPLLRTEDWVERFRGPTVYRETRAQELTEALWLHPESPWQNRINMLGEPGLSGVTQAAWIRSLLASFIKSAGGPNVAIGGLYGAPVGKDDLVIPWSGSQQAAFLIELWRAISDAVKGSLDDWAEALRHQLTGYRRDAAFEGPHTLLNSDPGVRTVLQVANDLTFLRREELGLMSWRDEVHASAADHDALSEALRSLRKQLIRGHLVELGKVLADFDWRSSTGGGLDTQQRTGRLAFRGSGGYRELRRQVLAHIAASTSGLAPLARTAAKRLGLKLQ